MSEKHLHESLNICFHQQPLEIDLDDGGKTNYPRFEGDVVPIPGLAAKEDENSYG